MRVFMWAYNRLNYCSHLCFLVLKYYSTVFACNLLLWEDHTPWSIRVGFDHVLSQWVIIRNDDRMFWRWSFEWHHRFFQDSQVISFDFISFNSWCLYQTMLKKLHLFTNKFLWVWQYFDFFVFKVLEYFWGFQLSSILLLLSDISFSKTTPIAFCDPV